MSRVLTCVGLCAAAGLCVYLWFETRGPDGERSAGFGRGRAGSRAHAGRPSRGSGKRPAA